MIEYVIGIGSGIVGGAIASAFGYLKTPNQQFDKIQFGRTAIIGGIIGGMIKVNPTLTIDGAGVILAASGITLLTETILKAIYRRLPAKLQIASKIGK
jgi:H+/Cl- antiporter ClcA